MAMHPRMLWFSVTTPAGEVVQFELPDSEQWFTRKDWENYKLLNELAADLGVTVEVSDKRKA